MQQNRNILIIFSRQPKRQAGVVLILFVLIAVVVLGLAFVAGSAGNIRLHQTQKNADEILIQSRLAITGLSMGAISSGSRPGNTTFPDVVSGTPGRYDGKAASRCFDSSKPTGLPLIATGLTIRCLGRLPWKDLGMQLSSIDEEDVLGNIPWFAVSANLVDTVCLDVFNSNIVNMTYAGYVCAGSTLPHPWLVVRDAQGNVLSDKVAMVFIAPGSPLAGQTRNPSPNLGGANQYLDSVTISGITYSNADLDNDFIAGKQTDTFNDVISYITVDEWMTAAEQRVGAELISSIASISSPKSFRALHGTLPWLAPFGNPTIASSFMPTVGIMKGLLPIYASGVDYPTSFTYRFDPVIALTYSTNPPAISKAVMDSYIGSNRIVSATSGTCKWTTTGKLEASCKETISTGLPGGVAKRIVEVLVLAPSAATVTYAFATATSLATRNVARLNSTALGLFAVTDYDSTNAVVASSFVTGGSASASVTGMNLPLNDVLPNWFVENRWQEIVYGVLAPDFAPGAANICGGACLTVGGRNDFQFVALTFGPKLLSQTRPSTQLNQYLDSAENLDSNNTFTNKGSPRTPIYNDQIFTFP